MISEYTLPDKFPSIASRIIDNEAVVIIPRENEVKVLNEVGSRIWDLIDGRKDIKQIATLISDEFSVSYNEALNDVIDFMEELHKKNMVVLR